MIHQDFFVGAVAIALGAIFVLTAALNWDWYFSLRKAKWLEARLGRSGARCAYAIVGLGLIGLGLAVASGFGPNAGKRRESSGRDRQRLQTAASGQESSDGQYLVS